MFLTVQYLRGIAALLVVFVHLELQLNRLGYNYVWPKSLEGGVDLFFVISGFVIWTASSRSDESIASFAYKRIVRIVPLYWLITTLIVFMMILAPATLQSTRYDLIHIITSFLFIPYQSPNQQLVYPTLVAGWTLNYEMFFYAIFAACLVFARRQRILYISALIIALVAAGYVIHPTSIAINFWLDPIILEFLYGVLAAILYIKLPRNHIIPAICFFGAIILWLILTQLDFSIHRAYSLGIPAFLIVLSAVTLEATRKIPVIPFAKLFGDSSYSLYLTHGIVLSATMQGWRWMGFQQASLMGYAILAILLCVIVGVVTYKLIDDPIQKLLRKRKLEATSDIVNTAVVSAPKANVAQS